jgi:hypothetical protein
VANSTAFCIKNGKVVCQSGNNLYIVSLADNTDVKQVTLASGEPFTTSYFYNNLSYKVGNRLYFTNSATSRGYSLNLDTGILKYRNVNANFEWNISNTNETGCAIFQLYGCKGKFVMLYPGGTYFRIYFKNLVDCLVTINNLDSPVTKTAAEIMKVTYTITQDLDV